MRTGGEYVSRDFENGGEITRYQQTVNQPAERTERQIIFDEVRDARDSVADREAVCVPPMPARTLFLHVDEHPRWLLTSISVNHLTGIPWMRSPYSINAPHFISIGVGLMMRNFSQGGVIISRFSASAKNEDLMSGPRLGRILAGAHSWCRDGLYRSSYIKRIQFLRDLHREMMAAAPVAHVNNVVLSL
jgi:hypothetical protein